METLQKSLDVIFFYQDRLMPIEGGGAARLFALTDHLRSTGLRVGLVTTNHGGTLNAQIASRLDRVWFYRPRYTLLHRMRARLPGAVRRPLQRVEKVLRRRLQRMRPGATGAPSYLSAKIDPGYIAFAASRARLSGARVAIAAYVWTARALAALPASVLTMIDTIDIQHQRRPNAIASGHDLPERDCSREEELRELAHGQALIAIQRGEAAVLREMMPRKRVVVAEHALNSFVRAPSAPDATEVFYVGNNYAPNVAGGLDFLDRVWPGVRARVPDARFVVCGKVCDGFAGRTDPGLVLEGRVPSLDVYYQRAAVVVNLVPYGTGLKIKTVEALSYGKCTVVTPAGAEGLQEAVEGLTICPLAAMEEHLVRFLQDPAARREAEGAAWAYACARLTPAAVYAEVTAMIKEHLSK